VLSAGLEEVSRCLLWETVAVDTSKADVADFMRIGSFYGTRMSTISSFSLSPSTSLSLDLLMRSLSRGFFV
jgi:hypothetical protein